MSAPTITIQDQADFNYRWSKLSSIDSLSHPNLGDLLQELSTSTGGTPNPLVPSSGTQGITGALTVSGSTTSGALYVNGGAAPTSTLFGIGENGSAMVLNVPSGDTFLLTIGGSPALYFQSTNNPILISTAAHAIEYPSNGNTGIRFVGSGASISTVFTSGISDSASAVAYLFNTGTHTLATPGALLLSVQNNGTEAFSVDYSGATTTSALSVNGGYHHPADREVGRGFATSPDFGGHGHHHVSLRGDDLLLLDRPGFRVSRCPPQAHRNSSPAAKRVALPSQRPM